ncbi:ABC transporter substrate-binding protein [Vibrio nigripulchritudo]|uniref:ABC transporter substrate-binding protein n=1 Tax=Vibrio nigripulchritudo TaxID=28173 RepID=UPI002492A50B|nr:ABC transporter substrate-binding protein [Vibrio nigripulchritudo]BDU36316.1 hypothetical protein TUMSATVNIG2_07850 [Vibrio nigripulchritudo]BDU41973.1 hypothetical protein TUMSATVNIG3_07710 [Vibrio nigripulchritudo]
MKKIASVFALAASMNLHAGTIEDDAGRKVEMPDEVQKVVGGHDALITLSLYELGFDVVGTFGRKDPVSGDWSVFGLKEIFNVTAKEAGMSPIGSYDGPDMEGMKKLSPDLIVLPEGTEAQADMLEDIAPVFIQNTFSNGVYGLSAQREMAERFGAHDKHDKLQSEYEARVADIRSRLPFNPEEKEFVAVIVLDQINVANGLSGMMQTMTDLGFKQPKWLKDAGFLVPLSPERIADIDTDLLLMMPAYVLPDRSEKITRGLLDKLAPGWELAIEADNKGNMIMADSLHLVTPTYAAAHNTLDLIEKHYGLNKK